MRFSQHPKIKASKALAIVFMAALSGGSIYLLSESLHFGVFAFFIVLVAIPMMKGVILSNQYRSYLSGFGRNYSTIYNSEIYDNSVFGFVPFKGRYAHCSVHADEEGIVISKTSVKRHIAWEDVVGHRVHDDQQGKYIELNLKNFSTENRLLIPWDQEFSCYLPSNS